MDHAFHVIGAIVTTYAVMSMTRTRMERGRKRTATEVALLMLIAMIWSAVHIKTPSSESTGHDIQLERRF